jgi:hypothetical protein
LTGLLRIDVSPTEKVRMIIISKGEGGKVHLVLPPEFFRIPLKLS